MSRLDNVGGEEDMVSKEKRKAFIAFVIDESGSMQTGKDETIRGINEQIQAIKNQFADSKEIEPIVSLVKFNERVSSVFINKTLSELKEFTDNEYSPNGMTAMYDGVGHMLNILEQTSEIDKEDSTVLIVVVSDGEENASKEHTSATIAERIKKFNETKRWTFTYLGANQDLSVVSQKTNIYAGNTMSFDSLSSNGYFRAFVFHNASFARYLTSLSATAVTNTFNFYENIDNVDEK